MAPKARTGDMDSRGGKKLLTCIGKVINGIYECYIYLYFCSPIVNNLHSPSNWIKAISYRCYASSLHHDYLHFCYVSFYQDYRKSNAFSSFLNQRKWENPALWHKTHLFMALNYLVILVGNNNGKSSCDDHNTYSLVTASTFYCLDSTFTLIHPYLKSVWFQAISLTLGHLALNDVSN